MKKYSRRTFISQLAALTGAAWIISCNDETDKNTTDKKQTTLLSKSEKNVPSTTTQLPQLITAENKEYNTLRQGFNARIDKHPKVIALCTNTQEVAASVLYANENKLPIAVKSGGHSMEGFSCNDGGLVVNLSKMNSVTLHNNNTITIQPGCTLSKLYEEILPKGYIIPGGSCGSVGIGGLCLGGGYGIFSRKMGLTCDHLIQATMVDGNGNIINTIDNPELLWALKGGGAGNFGIVTELTFTTERAPQQLQAHYFKSRGLNANKAAYLLSKWMEICKQLPESCFSGYVLNGTTLNILITNYDIDNKQLPSLLSQLAKETDQFHSSRIGSLGQMVKNYFGRKGPMHFRNSSAGYFNDYNDLNTFITPILDQVISTPGMIYQVNTLGGKINDIGLGNASCYPHRGYDFIAELQAYATNKHQEITTEKVTNNILKTIQENGLTRQYINYCSTAFNNWEHAYYGSNYEKLQSFKKKYDPQNNINHPQSIKL